MPLKGKNIVLCVTGGIAAYKAADLVSRLKKEGAEVEHDDIKERILVRKN